MADESSLCCTLFTLRDHGTVFMPPCQNCSFTPRSDNVLDLLKEIQSLSQAKRFRVFISSGGAVLSSVWKTIDKRCQGTFTDDFTTQKNVYKDDMVCDKWNNFNPVVKQKKPAKHQNTLHSKEHNSESLPPYTKGCQSAGMKRKDKSYADRQNPQVQFAEPCSEVLNALEESYLEKQLAAFMCWILEIDSHLEKACEQVFSDLGGAVSCGDMTEFNEIKSRCMAEIYYKPKVDQQQRLLGNWKLGSNSS
ncbi:predicted protein [Sclerotinia sclerotiorum 1980 UF-70]|uniref:Uncharacterized protein n=1 Tax=Sclerotinia sclerotiorum (strain ATCC 18683 / 1980 / Ss-1) TaxID=665079 RepID=A7ERV6_SCLS1|nr:predicted protein [Sclerotinia sclerotiorum 1980 UF-70]EDN92198.1 predicted protein [Sclerotinia sclerotiorum 1980 UF-70]